MTLSIVARCAETGELGIAAATGTPGVGKLLTWASPHAGAVATQGWINPYAGADGVELLANGHPASRVLDALVAMDQCSPQRQLGIVDGLGGAAAHTGEATEGWAGHRTSRNVAVQGNLLRSGEGVAAAFDRFAASSGALVERLIDALSDGIEAGGDRRGERSATVFIVANEVYPLWDVRVDDAREPIDELRRLKNVLFEELMDQLRLLPTRHEPSGRASTQSRDGLV